tara:strand:+ start:1063 stop:1275 length:213 start_codon:yes stop_codon:yes gene_type:complete
MITSSLSSLHENKLEVIIIIANSNLKVFIVLFLIIVEIIVLVSILLIDRIRNGHEKITAHSGDILPIGIG